MTSSQTNKEIILHGVLQTFNGKSNGRIYDKDMYKDAVENYLNKIKVEKRDEIIDCILDNKEIKIEEDSFEIDNVGDGSFSIRDISLDDDTDALNIDVVYLQPTPIDYITCDFTILNTGLEL